MHLYCWRAAGRKDRTQIAGLCGKHQYSSSPVILLDIAAADVLKLILRPCACIWKQEQHTARPILVQVIYINTHIYICSCVYIYIYVYVCVSCIMYAPYTYIHMYDIFIINSGSMLHSPCLTTPSMRMRKPPRSFMPPAPA